MPTILSVPKEFIHAFIEERGVAHGGKTGDELYQSVFHARKDDLIEMWNAYIKIRKKYDKTDSAARNRDYKRFISTRILADND